MVSDVLKSLIMIPLLLLLSCKSGDRSYSPCEERCKYIEQDCLSLCNPGAISFTLDYGSGEAGVSSCHGRCSLIYDRCLKECSLEKNGEE